MVKHNLYMSLALQEAWKYQGLTYPNPAVGALILDKNGKIISIEAHKKAGLPHAELECIKKAYQIFTKDIKIGTISNPNELHAYLLKNHNNLFKKCKIYVTLEPCNHQGATPPCSKLIATLGFEEVIIGTLEKNKTAIGGLDTIKQKGIKVIQGCMQKECEYLIEPFLKWQKEQFILFKIALNQNGTYDTGTISSQKSREFTHKIRDKIDLLVIGGNTVRIDRPTLDARLINAKAPDILIYSHQKNFDKTIPLFQVKNRKVFIEDNLEKIKKYKYILIEGGSNMLEATKDIIDWYLFFIAPKIKKGKCLQNNFTLTTLHKDTISNDLIIWSKINNKKEITT